MFEKYRLSINVDKSNNNMCKIISQDLLFKLIGYFKL